MTREVELVDAAENDVVDLHGVGRGERWPGHEESNALKSKVA